MKENLVHHRLSWVKFEFSAVKQDRYSKTCEGAEAAGGRLDDLYLGVEALGDGIGDCVDGVVEQPRQMVAEQAGNLAHGFKPGGRGLRVPLREEAAGAFARRKGPEVLEVLPRAPRLGHLQVAALQFGEAALFLGAPFFRGLL